jgi:flavin-dependent dehydrogenase
MSASSSPPPSASPDVVVVGGGTAGAAVAHFLAVRGIRTLLVEARERANAGACWINGIEDDLFPAVDLPAPPADVFYHHAPAFHMQAGTDGPRTIVRDPPTMEVDMRALNRWLLELAEEAGATLQFRTRATVARDAEGWFVRVRNQELRPACVVDASGLPTAHWGLDPALHICTAWQGVYAVTDAAAAAAWCERHRVAPGETLSFTGVEGGYSILNVLWIPERGEVAILTGTLLREGYRRAGTIAGEFVRATPWIGRRRFGGGGLIPLAPFPGPTVDDRLVRLGNAAGQVFSQHGSGVAQGIRAASLAANAIAAAIQIGDTSAAGLWSFEHEHQITAGRTLAAWQPLRLLSSSLSPHETELLFAAGVLNARSAHAALAQKLPPEDLRMVPGLLRHARDLLPMAPRLVESLRVSHAMRDHYARHPARGPSSDYDDWNMKQGRLMRRAERLGFRA